LIHINTVPNFDQVRDLMIEEINPLHRSEIDPNPKRQGVSAAAGVKTG